MTVARQRFGHEGEDAAAQMLADKGYRIVDRNVRTEFGEIDVIAEKDGEIVFAEVKSRHDLSFGFPEESITPTKRRHLEASAECILRDRHWTARPYRFDVIAILYDGDRVKDLQHFEAI